MAAKLEAGDTCAARTEALALQSETIAALNAGRIPAAFQEELGSSVNALAASIECKSARPVGPDEARGLSAWLRENAG